MYLIDYRNRGEIAEVLKRYFSVKSRADLQLVDTVASLSAELADHAWVAIRLLFAALERCDDYAESSSEDYEAGERETHPIYAYAHLRSAFSDLLVYVANRWDDQSFLLRGTYLLDRILPEDDRLFQPGESPYTDVFTAYAIKDDSVLVALDRSIFSYAIFEPGFEASVRDVIHRRGAFRPITEAMRAAASAIAQAICELSRRLIIFWCVLARLLGRDHESAFLGYDREVRAFLEAQDESTLPAYLTASARYALTSGLTVQCEDDELTHVLERYSSGDEFT